MRRIRLVLAPLRNHEIAFGCESVAAAPPSPRRPPCLPAFPAVARGAPTVRIARSARHLAVTSLRSCARLRLRGYPLLRFGAFTLGCSSAVRCVLHSRMHTAWLGVEYHILRQSAHLRGALRIPSLERSRVSCRASPCSVALSVATFPIYYCGAFCALEPHIARLLLQSKV